MTDAVKTKKVKITETEIKAPPSWAGGQWQKAGVPPVRFDAKGKAWVVTKQGDTEATIPTMGPDGLEDVPIVDVICTQPDFEKGKTRSHEIEVPVED